jgi:type I restriction enzyme S subunit
MRDLEFQATDWPELTLGDVCAFRGGTGFPESHQGRPTGDHPFIKVSDLTLEGNEKYITRSQNWVSSAALRELGARLQPTGAVVFAKVGAALKLNRRRILSRPTAIDNNMMAAIPNVQQLDGEFLYYFLQIQDLGRFSQESAVPSVNQGHLSSIEISLPPLPEQRKIAEILRTWDEAIEKLEALRAAKARRITSVRQRLFEAAYASHNRLQRASDIFEPVSERARPDLPLLAVMQDIGIVRRDELDRRVAMPDGDTSSYKVVRPGDFVISLRSFEGGLEYSTITGLVSPAYTVLRPTTELVGDYYRHFFKSRSFIGRLEKLIFGIRDGKQIAFRDFGDMYIPAPPVAEQETQSRALRSLEAELALEKERIEALTRQKRGLMQKLLTGEWRVTVDAEQGEVP